MKQTLELRRVFELARAMDAVESGKPSMSLRGQIRWAGMRKELFGHVERVQELIRERLKGETTEEGKEAAADKLNQELALETVEVDLPLPIPHDFFTGPIDAPLSVITSLVGVVLAPEENGSPHAG